MMKYGLQMYTLRELTGGDMPGILKKVADMGYEGVELAGFGSSTPEEMPALLRENGLSLISAHIGYQDLQKDGPLWAERMQAMDCARITLPWMDPRRLEADSIGQTADMINELAEQLKPHGIELSYHNHDFEFVDGRYDRLMQLCPALKFELDTYWVRFAGFDPVEVMKRYADRIVLVHLKDMLDKDPVTHEDPNPVLMTGTVDVAAIVGQAEAMRIPWGIVEMDRPVGDPLAAVEESLRNLKKAE